MQQQAPAPSPTGVSGLLRQLVASCLPPGAAGDPTAAAQEQHLHALALRLAQGGPRWRAQADEQQIVQQAQRDIAHRLMHVDRDLGVANAVQFQELHRRWRHLHAIESASGTTPLVQRRPELLYLLHQLQGAGDQRAAHHAMPVTAFADNYNLAHHSQVAPPVQRHSPYAVDPSSTALTAAASPSSSAPASTPTITFPAAFTAPLTSSQLTEAELLRDILYILLGTDGNHVKYHAPTDAFLLLPGLRIERPQRLLVQRVCELGWLYRKVNKYVNGIMEGGGLATLATAAFGKRVTLAPNDHSGKIEQSFAATLREELNEYIRFITLLETQVEKELRSAAFVTSNPSAATPAHDSAQFTLKRLLVFIQDAMLTMSLLAMLADAARGVKGGCLASAIGTHLRHGDPFVVNLMKRIMAKTCVPLFELIRDWVSTGTLNDPYSEFFVVSHAGVPLDRLWVDKYSLRRGMIPSFFNEGLVHKILGIGKAVNFIRINCKDPKYQVEFKVDYRQMFSNGTDLSGFSASIDVAFDSVNAHLLSLLTHRYHFLTHAMALKKYLLLSAGDFSAHLLELVAKDLDKPARDLSTAHLLGVLEAAKRGSTARDEPEEVQGRLSMPRLVARADEPGWEHFSLEYRLDDSPLRAVFTPRHMARYQQLFEFLWQLKRVEARLNTAWAVQTTLGHSAALRTLGNTLLDSRGRNTLAPFLRNVAGLRHEMAHFVLNLHSYMMFEVLECAWEEFVKKIRMGPHAVPTATTAAVPKTAPSTPGGVVSFNFNNVVPSTSSVPASAAGPAKEQLKPLDLDGLIHAHKVFLQQIVDKALMGGESGSLLPQLLTLFKLVLEYATFNERLYACLQAEVARRAEAERAIVRSEAAGRWNKGVSVASPASAQAFLRELAGFVSEFRTLNHNFHSAFVGFLKILRETNRAATLAAKLGAQAHAHAGHPQDHDDGQDTSALDDSTAAELEAEADAPGSFDPLTGAQGGRARRTALHLHSLDFLRFRLDFNEFYAANRKDHTRMLAHYQDLQAGGGGAPAAASSKSATGRPGGSLDVLAAAAGSKALPLQRPLSSTVAPPRSATTAAAGYSFSR